jgi:Tetratricopeptide repeat
MPGLIPLTRQAGRWTRRAVLLAALACSASAVHAQASGESVPARSPKTDWMDMSNWANWWPWRDTRPPPPTGVENPHYGDSLFYFFQGRYFTSVTQLMVSQQFGRMAPHDDEAEILRGGLFLSYGMHREAGEVFATLIQRGAKQPVRDRAWYYLAKIRYQRGLYAESEDALGRIEKRLPGELEEDRALLQANVLMARGKYAEAIKVLEALAKGPGATSYVRYNLGVALVRSGDLARGTPLLDAVGKLPAASEEYRSLRDKANVALGFASLQEGRAEQARSYLERVRLSGMYSNKALLGFGWAAAAQGQMKKALVPWSELAARNPRDASVLEAQLAVPYALADLGANARALELYQEAIGVFDRESVNLDASVAAIRSGKLLDGLISSNPGDEMGWFWNIAKLPDAQELPLGSHLAQLMAAHEFQEAFKNYRDLLYLARNLQQWQESLGVLRDMLANRRQAFAERLPQVREKANTLNLAGFGQQVDALLAELDRAERDADAAAFATPRERELQARLDRVHEALERAGSDPELGEARERYRRVAGALLWQQSDQFAVRLWNARKGMQELQRNLAQAQQRDAALAVAQRDEPARLDAFASRIDALSARLDTMVPRVVALTQEQQVAVQELAVADLLRQKERLAEYGTQARFAVAQIYDRASLSREGSRAPAQ